MKIIQKGNRWYHLIETLECPFNEKNVYIILDHGEILYWEDIGVGTFFDQKFNIEMMKEKISTNEILKWRSEIRKQKTLTFLRETLSKMIAYEREIKINEVLDKTNKENLWLYC